MLFRSRGGRVVAVHVVQVPDQTPLEYSAEHVDELDESEDLLEQAREDATTRDVPIETHTIMSHRSFEEIFDAAKTHDADMVVMGWGEDAHGSPGRAESAYDELTRSLPCDVLLFRDRGLDASRILLPTAGGPDSELGAAVARVLQDRSGGDVTLLHGADDAAAGEQFLANWAEEHGLADAERSVVTGDVETAIEDAAAEHTLLVMGASEQGLLRRLVAGSLPIDVVADVDCSVILAERAHDRGLWERLFG